MVELDFHGSRGACSTLCRTSQRTSSQARVSRGEHLPAISHRNAMLKRVTEMVEGMQEVTWPNRAGTTAFPFMVAILAPSD
jgi:hypothetical protein